MTVEGEVDLDPSRVSLKSPNLKEPSQSRWADAEKVSKMVFNEGQRDALSPAASLPSGPDAAARRTSPRRHHWSGCR